MIVEKLGMRRVWRDGALFGENEIPSSLVPKEGFTSESTQCKFCGALAFLGLPYDKLLADGQTRGRERTVCCTRRDGVNPACRVYTVGVA